VRRFTQKTLFLLIYLIPTSETVKLSFGIKATANLFNLDVSRLNPVDNDLVCKTLIINFLQYWGWSLHSDKAYVGLSIPNFIESNRYNDNEVAIF
jgi:hypothetical protein